MSSSLEQNVFVGFDRSTTFKNTPTTTRLATSHSSAEIVYPTNQVREPLWRTVHTTRTWSPPRPMHRTQHAAGTVGAT